MAELLKWRAIHSTLVLARNLSAIDRREFRLWDRHVPFSIAKKNFVDIGPCQCLWI
jgi:hypothetical protein